MSLADLKTIVAEPWEDWGLIDSGDGQKWERYGPVTVVRPEPQAMWAPALRRLVARRDLRSRLRRGGRRALGPPPRRAARLAAVARQCPLPCQPDAVPPPRLFPDMAPQWDWMRERAADADVLNLFGYTGVGTLLLCDAGARLVHVDASKKSVEGGRANAALSGLAERPIRWIVDDAAKFTAREVRRGRRYDGILLDPPKFGRGPEGEVWRLEEHLAPLLADCRKLLDADSRFLVLTVYAVRMSALASANCCGRLPPTWAARSNAGKWRCARKRGDCCCRPRFSPAGRATRFCAARIAAPVDKRRAGDHQQGHRRFQLSAALSPSPVAAAPKITSGTASGISSSPASAPARGRPAVSAATATASAARAGVPMASAIRLRASAGPSRPTRKLPGTAAISRAARRSASGRPSWPRRPLPR